MHIRYAVSLAVAFSLVTLLVLRFHLRDLGEIVRTYSGFYTYLRHNPETLYIYSPIAQAASSTTTTALVPPVFHHIFLTEGNQDASLSHYDNELASCRALHPNWTTHVWNDSNADQFMLDHYPDLHPHYNGYGQRIQRANVLRYALLHHFGGVYLDLDITCLQPLDDLRTLPWLTPGAHPAGVNNAFIAARPGHPFLAHIIAKLPSRDLPWGLPYVENMLSTGCMYFSNRWMDYARSLTKRLKHGETVAEQDRIYVLADEHGGLNAHMLRGAVITPLFKHAGASSWHGWDASAFLLIGNHYGYVLAVFGVLWLVAGAHVTMRAWRRRSHRRQRSLSPVHRKSKLTGWISDDEEKQLEVRRGSAESRTSFFSLRKSGSFPLPRTE